MYRFYLNRVNNDYHYAELIRVFISDDDFEIISIDWPIDVNTPINTNSYLVNASGSDDRDEIKRELYKLLCKITGENSDWGTLTGVRPLKLAYDLYNSLRSFEQVRNVMAGKYLISDSKLDLLMNILEYQVENVCQADGRVGVYVGIPFCPTRCAYCSFASNVAPEEKISEYLEKLLIEIEGMGDLMKAHGTIVESVYIGGGTPTTLSAEQLNSLISHIESSMNVNPSDIEFTVEAGRPDTITESKLKTLRENGVSRISINPQSMKDETLVKIGRSHTSKDILQAFELAKMYDFDVINADLIAGLPDETVDDFSNSLSKIIELGAENITVHTLSVKNGSRLRDDDPEYFRRNENTVSNMLETSRNMLNEAGYYPYYIYRQKHQIGAFENVGYCKLDKHSIYNIRIMEEKQTIIALGAGAIGKVYYPSEDRLERIANVSNYIVYNERFNEMLERKNKYYGDQL